MDCTANALRTGEKNNFVLRGPSKIVADDTKPLVVLAGWVGCKHRYLSKFSGLLNKAGYTTIESICPKTAIFFPTTHLRQRWTESLLDYVDAVDPSRRPVVLWAFSNGGAFPVSIISRLATQDHRYKHWRSRIQGALFDSAPCYMHGTVGARALGEGQPAPIRLLLAVVFFLVMIFMALLDPGGPQRFWSEMTSLPLGRHTLYLYSADDPLCDPAKLEQLVEVRRGAGHAVTAHRWEVSRHVAHYKMHPEEYSRLVLGFLEGLQQHEQQQP